MGGLAGGKKSACRQLADLLAAYGSGLLQGRRLEYADWVGLWLNLPRVRLRNAHAVSEGVAAASGPGQLAHAWADALAGLDEEVEFTDYWINNERATARARARLGM